MVPMYSCFHHNDDDPLQLHRSSNPYSYPPNAKPGANNLSNTNFECLLLSPYLGNLFLPKLD